MAVSRARAIPQAQKSGLRGVPGRSRPLAGRRAPIASAAPWGRLQSRAHLDLVLCCYSSCLERLQVLRARALARRNGSVGAAAQGVCAAPRAPNPSRSSVARRRPLQVTVSATTIAGRQPAAGSPPALPSATLHRPHASGPLHAGRRHLLHSGDGPPPARRRPLAAALEPAAAADGTMALQQPGLGGGGTEPSLELDILALSQRWEARRTIRNGDTPGPLWGAGTAKGGAGASSGQPAGRTDTALCRWRNIPPTITWPPALQARAPRWPTLPTWRRARRPTPSA